MRTSNKILLGIFLTIVLVLTGIHLVLYAMFKAGDFTSLKVLEIDRFKRIPIKPVNHIVVKGLVYFSISPSDSMRLDIEKTDNHNQVRYALSGDTLIIHGDTTIYGVDKKAVIQLSRQSVNLYGLAGASIIADNTELYMAGSADSTRANSWNIVLENDAHFHLNDNDWQDSSARYYNKIDIQANGNSSIELSKYAKLKELNLQLKNAHFEDKEAVINKIQAVADKTSSISLSGTNINLLNK
jgi:hypothetical protein